METRDNNNTKITIEQLIKKYPKIFVKTRETIQWEGLPVPWMKVVDVLCQSIQNYIDNVPVLEKNPNFIGNSIYNPEDINTHRYISVKLPQILCTRLKERDGLLKFYTNIEVPQIQGMIYLAYLQCYNMCEYCGSDEKLGNTTIGWKIICCEQCKTKNNITGWDLR
jgi:hypothetical protein